MYILVNDKNFIVAVARGGKLKNGIQVEDCNFTEDIQAYQYVDGKIVLNKEKLKELQKEQLAQEELQELQEVLSETNAVALQWWEENELGFEHEMSEDQFQLVMEKRRQARLRLKKLSEVIKC